MTKRDIITGLLVAMFLTACHEKEMISDTPADKESSEMRFSLNGGYLANITSPGIRVLAFDTHNKFQMEPTTIPLADTSSVHTVVMPPGNNTIVLLGNAGTQGVQGPLATTLMPYVTQLTDVMFQLSVMNNGTLAAPAQFYYGKGVFASSSGTTPQKLLLKNLCSKVDVNFSNIEPYAIDSVHMYIENVGKAMTFDGLAVGSGQTQTYTFRSGTNGLVKADSFLVFPNVVGVTPIVDASFYLHSGNIRKFKKVLTGYNFTSNKILRFTYNMQGVQDSILLNIAVADWAGSSAELITSRLMLQMNMASGGQASRYTKADVILQHNLASGAPYAEEFHGLPLIANGSTLTLKTPIPNLDQRAYQITGITLYDTEGSFSALSAPVSITDLQLGLNTVNVNVFGRRSYENSLLKKWLLVMDGNGGNTYPGVAIVSQINSNAQLDILTTIIAPDIQTTVINGETRITGLQWNNKNLAHFTVTSNVGGLTKLSTLNLSGNLLTSIDVSSIPTLSNVNFSGNVLTSINIAGCRGITSFTSALFPTVALLNLNCSGTGITTLPPLMPLLTSLLWSGCGVTQTNVQVVLGYPALQTLDISANLLTAYPNVQGLLRLTNYNVSGNNIISCALSYMKIFNTANILPQRTGFNWWCP